MIMPMIKMMMMTTIFTVVSAQSPVPAATPTDGCCARCIGKTSDKPYTYDPVIHDQCAAAKGLCCYNCGQDGATKPTIENADFGDDGTSPQVKEGEWIQVNWPAVARVTYEYYRVNQTKVTTVRNSSLEARPSKDDNATFFICAKGAGTIVLRGWGRDACLSATPESSITIVPGATTGDDPTTCTAKIASKDNQNPQDDGMISNDRHQSGSTHDVTAQSVVDQCNLQRASIKTKADGTQECVCAAEWTGPPTCSGFPWWKICVTLGGAIAAVLSIVVSARAFMNSRKLKKATTTDDPMLGEAADSITIVGNDVDFDARRSNDVYQYIEPRPPAKECTF